MKIKNPGFQKGYTPITKMNDPSWDDPKSTKMDFGVLKLEPKGKYSIPKGLEKAVLLLSGNVEWSWMKDNTPEETIIATRKSLFDENGWCILLTADYSLDISTQEHSAEMIIIQTKNSQLNSPQLFKPNDWQSEQRGAGTMRETSTRIVRTIFDKKNAPNSNLVLGEVVNYGGKWSSYPPHGHPQPEIYHYRFLPSNGFGFGMMGYDDVVTVKDGDTTTIFNNLVHSQTSAPGYAMCYIWAIRHLDGNPYGIVKFDPEHAWVMDPKNDGKIWP